MSHDTIDQLTEAGKKAGLTAADAGRAALEAVTNLPEYLAKLVESERHRLNGDNDDPPAE